MIDGIHRNIPASEMAAFIRDLLTQANDDQVTLDIQQTPQPDGRVTLSWHVVLQGADVHASAGGAPMPQPDPQSLVLTAQRAIAATLQQASAEPARSSLRRMLAALSEVLAHPAPRADQAEVNQVNQLLDQVQAAAALTGGDALPQPPADLAQAAQLLGDSLGAQAQALRGGLAEEEAAEPQPAPRPRARAAAAAASGLLRNDGAALFANCAIRPERADDVRRVAERIVANAARYQAVSDRLGGLIPFFLIGIFHSLEAGFSFTTHLHNGDPLSARTVHVPKGRPAIGVPPFAWAESAADALRGHGLDQIKDWRLEVILDQLERYNGAGYVKRGMNSPYLWSFSQHWERGKFVKDGVFDPQAGSAQCGGAVVLKWLVDHGAVTLTGKAKQASAEAALGHRMPAALGLGVGQPAFVRAEIGFPGDVGSGSGNTMAVRRVQEWCTFHGSPTPIDGGFGSGTEQAVQTFQQRAGIPASGAVDLRTWSALTAPMLAALAPLPAKPADVSHAIVAVGRQHVRQKPVELGGDNLGAWVRLYMLGHDGAEQQWCAGFACFVMQQAFAVAGVAMTMRRQSGVQALIDDAKRDGRFVPGTDVATPTSRFARLKPGCLFVIKTDSQSHTGIIVEVRGDGFSSVEGNTNQSGSSRGFQAIEMARNYAGKDFVLFG